MPKEPVVYCPHCGASMKKHWHRLSAGLATVLIKFRAAVIAHNHNDLHVPRDITLTKTEYNNFQKLRYHAMIAKVKNNDGDHISGHWLLTKRGNQFCKNLISVPDNVQTFRNKISNKSNKPVTIYDVLKMKDGDSPYWDAIHNFAYELHDVPDSEIETDMLTDTHGNGILFKD